MTRSHSAELAAAHTTIEQLRLALTVGSLGVWAIDLQAQTASFDATLQQMLGVPPELTAEAAWATVHADDRDAVQAVCAQLTGADYADAVIQYRAVRQSDLQSIWVEARARAVFATAAPGEPARPVGLFCVLRDVSRHRAVEESLSESEERLRLASEGANVGAWSYDPRRNQTYWSPQTRAMLGFGLDEPPGPPLSVTYADDLPAARAAVAQALDPAGNGEFFVEQRVVRRDGAVMWVELRARARFVETPAGRAAVSLTGVMLDISRRKETERASHERQRHLDVLARVGRRLILNPDFGAAAIHDVFDSVRDVIEADRSVVFLAGAEAGVLRLEASSGLTEAQRAACVVIPVGDPLCGTVARQRELLVARDIDIGALHDTVAYAAGARAFAGFPLLAHGQLLGVAGFAVKDRNQFSDTDLRLIKTVCDQVAATLERARLFAELQARERALRDADRKKDHFIATLAHELRNPLAPVRTAVALLRAHDGTNPVLDQGREVIDRQVTHMTRLLDDLLEIGRLSTGKVRLQRVRVPLKEAIAHAVEAARPLIDRHRHVLTLHVPDGEIIVEGDLTRLAQIFSNLLTNAAKYTDDGGRIDLTARGESGWVTVAVADTGIGMTAEQLSRVFEMFSQAESALDRTDGGLGIGLSLVRGLVELHGGSVEAMSAGPGHGSTVTVRLPMVLHPAPPMGPAAPHEHVAAGARRVLIIDDNRDSADTLALLLETVGYTARTAYDGEDALSTADEFRPEIILLDLGLPKLNGFEVCRRLRAQPWAASVPIVATTGWGREDDLKKTEQAGFTHHLVKPLDPATLLDLLATAAAAGNS